MDVIGIGYEGLTLPDLVSRLSALGVSRVVDVRFAARSRKRDFNKTALASGLASAGIGYTHVPALGNPPSNRPGFGGPPEALAASRAYYASLMQTPALSLVASLASREKVALLCFEADQSRCHRDVILSALS
ncbi:hypothetical protein Ais01nite_77870 [Asanoa ishikariensis]|uniref:DUF488 domain-containing protein n=1 Tax=Asanoa ishikariensis TaxID=137265 RepID=A0A1H3KS03_9ACTN|nr:DUF488 domain-containing protein [Asanoa ishikariensis]GIF69752.1 hypothetical protein Ais01nite_77870 [Asanoa ishikariensis]SDY54425.1 Protein of unknown function, DUF488 [Asanoa ishikariensis]